MKLEDLETEALRLTAAERAQLAAKLMASLDDLTESECLELWANEAQRRDVEMDSDDQGGRPADVVFGELEARMK